MTKINIADVIESLGLVFEIELNEAKAAIMNAKERKDPEGVLMGASYIMGMERAKNMIKAILRGGEDH